MGRLEDGRVAFVPFALPDELVEIEINEEKRGFVRGEVKEIIEPSSTRIKPRCTHYMQCGGCHYQHLSYEDQLAAKSEIVVDQLQRIGGIEDVPIKGIIPSENEWNYRNHVQFHLNKDGKLGFMAGRSEQVIPIEECFLMQPALEELWGSFGLEANPEIKRIGLRSGLDGEMLVFETSTDDALEFSVDFPISAVQLGPNSYYVLSGDDHITKEVLGRQFRVTAHAKT